MADEVMSVDERKKGGLWIMLVIFFIFLFAIVVMVIVAIFNYDDGLPEKIDIVILDVGRGRDVNQVKAVRKYMKWYTRIHVLSPDPAPTNNYGDEVRYITWTAPGADHEAKMKAGFEYITSIPDISDHAIFFGDATVPCKKVYKTYLFHDKRPRMFAFLRDEPEATFLASRLNYTAPVYPMEVGNLRDAGTVDRAVIRELTQDRLVKADALNRDILVDSGDLNDAKEQYNNLKDHTPLFATFHVTGTDVDAAVQHSNDFLTSYF